MSTGLVVSICFLILDKVDVLWLVQRPELNMDILIKCVVIKAACSFLVLVCFYDAYVHSMLY